MAATTVPRTAPWALGGAALVVLLLVASWLLVLGPQRAEAADLRTQAVDQEQVNSALEARVQELKTQYADLPQHQADFAALQVEIPTAPAVPALLRGLRASAAEAGVSLDGFVPGAAATAVAATAPTTTDGTTTTTTTTTTTDGTAVVAATPDPASSLVTVPVTLTASGSYAGLQRFLASVQGADRLLLVATTSFAADSSGSATGTGSLALTVTGSVFALPDTAAGATAAASATAPAAADSSAAAAATTTN